MVQTINELTSADATLADFVLPAPSALVLCNIIISKTYYFIIVWFKIIKIPGRTISVDNFMAGEVVDGRILLLPLFLSVITSQFKESRLPRILYKHKY